MPGSGCGASSKMVGSGSMVIGGPKSVETSLDAADTSVCATRTVVAFLRCESSICQHLYCVGAADFFQGCFEFTIRTYLHGNIQDNGKVAGEFQAESDFRLAWLVLE